jgi:hypothetical protein
MEIDSTQAASPVERDQGAQAAPRLIAIPEIVPFTLPDLSLASEVVFVGLSKLPKSVTSA